MPVQSPVFESIHISGVSICSFLVEFGSERKHLLKAVAVNVVRRDEPFLAQSVRVVLIVDKIR